MTQKKKVTTGRPSKFKAEFATVAKVLYELGATDEEAAKAFGITRMTLTRWRKKYAEFSAALKAGKSIADGKVQRSLFQRACGYSHPLEKIFIHNGNALRVQTTKHYPPDTTACIFWLKNRQPVKWREKQELKVDGLQSVYDVIPIPREIAGGQKR